MGQLINDEVKVLIVDDKVENIYALERILSDLNIIIDRATSGNEALSLSVRNEYAVILLDVQMPEMDGFETANYLLENQVTKSIPIIFITAINREESNVFKAYKTGAVDFLFKPINADILFSKVKVFIELYRQRKELDRSREIEVLNEKLQENYSKIEKKNEELIEFAYRTSHDLKLPLLSIKELSSLARDCGEDIDKMRKYLSFIEDNCNKLIATTSGILDLTVVDLKEEEEVEMTSQEAKDEIFSIYRGEAEKCGIRLNFHSNVKDRFLIKKNNYVQIISNLVSNAIKYYDSKKDDSFLNIEISKVGNNLITTVQDNGLGIPEVYHSTVYEMFKRYHPQISFGSGLGMAIVKKNIEKVNGKIEFMSVEYEGTKFVISIPIKRKVIHEKRNSNN